METEIERGLFKAPAFKLSDRRSLLQRVYDALLNDKNAVLDFKGGTHRYTADELANWQSRQVIADLIMTFPSTVPPPTKVEAPATDPAKALA
jgi:hypothetical protein